MIFTLFYPSLSIDNRAFVEPVMSWSHRVIAVIMYRNAHSARGAVRTTTELKRKAHSTILISLSMDAR